jgi:hypothetical protein
MKQMDINKKWKRKAQRFIARATYSLGELEKRTDKVSRSEAKAIAQACSDFGGRIKPVAAIFERDRRTVSSVLAKTELHIAIMAYKRLREGQQESEQLRHLAEFLSQWRSELPLPLNYLGNEDLSKGTAPKGDTIWTGITIMWNYSPGGPVVRRFWVEDAAKFRLMQKYMPHSEVWGSFSDCKQLGGKIITACSALARDIRERSEKQTGLQIVDTGKLGLDRFFAWTIMRILSTSSLTTGKEILITLSASEMTCVTCVGVTIPSLS